MNKSIAVLGLGKYGASLAENLYAMGADVLVADKDEEKVKDFATKSTTAMCVDLSDENDLRLLGLGNMDVVVSAMGKYLAPSIMSVFVAKEEKVPFVLAKASSSRMAQVLKRVGADKVVDPEEESGKRSAKILLSSSYLDIFDISDSLEIAKIHPKPEWVGKSLKTLGLREKFGLNVAAMNSGKDNWCLPSPDKELKEEDQMLVVMELNGKKILL